MKNVHIFNWHILHAFSISITRHKAAIQYESPICKLGRLQKLPKMTFKSLPWTARDGLKRVFGLKLSLSIFYLLFVWVNF